MVINISKDEIIKSLFDNILELSELSSIIVGNDFTLQISSTRNPPKKIDGLSYIDLGECANILRQTYQLGPNSNLFVSQIDSSNEATATPKVDYQVYDSEGNVLDISVCDSSNGISVSLPIINNEIVNIIWQFQRVWILMCNR